MTMGGGLLPRNDMEDVPVLGIAARRGAVGFLLLEHFELEARRAGPVASSRPTKVMPGRPTQLSRGPYHWPLKRPPGGRASRMRSHTAWKALRLAKRQGEARIHQAEADRQRHVLKSRHDRRDVAAGRQGAGLQLPQGLGLGVDGDHLPAAAQHLDHVAAVAAAEIDGERVGCRRTERGRGRRSACGAAAGRAASRNRPPSRLICLPSCARLIRPALVACHSCDRIASNDKKIMLGRN